MWGGGVDFRLEGFGFGVWGYDEVGFGREGWRRARRGAVTRRSLQPGMKVRQCLRLQIV